MASNQSTKQPEATFCPFLLIAAPTRGNEVFNIVYVCNLKTMEQPFCEPTFLCGINGDQMIDRDIFFVQQATAVGAEITLTLSNTGVSVKKLLSVIIASAILREINVKHKSVLFAKTLRSRNIVTG